MKTKVVKIEICICGENVTIVRFNDEFWNRYVRRRTSKTPITKKNTNRAKLLKFKCLP